MEIDCNTVTVAELLEINAEFEMNVPGCLVNMFDLRVIVHRSSPTHV